MFGLSFSLDELAIGYLMAAVLHVPFWLVFLYQAVDRSGKDFRRIFSDWLIMGGVLVASFFWIFAWVLVCWDSAQQKIWYPVHIVGTVLGSARSKKAIGI